MPTRADAAARKTRWAPRTLFRQVTTGSCVGWNSHERCTTAVASARCPARSSSAMSALAHSVFGAVHSGRRRATPSTDETSGSAASASTTLVPMLPVAPTTTTRM